MPTKRVLPTLSLPGLTCLVTGATGFIGRHLVALLAAAGVQAHALSRSGRAVPGARHNWVCRLDDEDEVRGVMAEVRPAVVFHLASQVTGARDAAQVLPTFRDNLQSTLNLLQAALDHGRPRVVLAGSMEEPDLATGDCTPCSPYAASKVAAGLYARMFRNLYDLDVRMARIFMVYGPGAQDEKKLVPFLIRSLRAGMSPPMSSGSRPVDWVYVEDVARGLMAMAESPDPDPSPVDLGSGVATTVRAMGESLQTLVGGPGAIGFGALPDRPLETIRLAAPARTFARIGWSPTVPLDEGLRRTLAWFDANPAPTA